MNTNNKLRQKSWQTLFAKNLSNHSDENFKLAQFFKTHNGSILFDLRETFKGRATDVGVLLLLPEYNWLKNVILSSDSSVHTLEHNNRIITIDKSLPDYLITVQKISGKVTKLVLRVFEISNLVTFIQQSNEQMKSECGSMEFTEKSFYRITIN